MPILNLSWEEVHFLANDGDARLMGGEYSENPEDQAKLISITEKAINVLKRGR